MEYFFVFAAALSFMGALTAVLQVRQIGWAVWIWFGSGWINGELALWLIGGQLSFVALWIVSAGVTTPAFAVGAVTTDRGLGPACAGSTRWI